MIICPRCGTKNNDNFNCCYNCGNPLNKKTIEEPEIEEQSEVLDQEAVDQVQSNEEQSEENNYNEYSDADEQFEDIPSAYSSSAYLNQQTVVHTSKKNNATGTKPKKKKSEIYLSKAVAVIVIAIVAIIIVWGTIKLMDKMFSGPITPSPTPSQTHQIKDPTQLNADVYSYTDTDINGDKFFKIAINTNGDKVYIMNKEYSVVDGTVSLQLTEYDIYCTYRPSYIQLGEKFDAEIPVIVKKEGFADYTHTFQLKEISTPMIPMELLSPTDLNATVYKTSTTLSFKTLPGAEVFINGEDYTKSNFDSATGIFSIDILTPPQSDPYRYEIKIESNEFRSRTVLYELTRSTGHDPDQKTILELDKIIYEVNAEETIKVTGTFTGAKDDLNFYGRNLKDAKNLEVVSVTFNDDGNGSFVAVLKCTLLGWTEVLVECKTDLGINETIYVKNLKDGMDTIYKSSWGINSNYSKLAESESNYPGQYFVIGYGMGAEQKAKVSAIKKTEAGYALAVNITPKNETETLVWVELLSDTCTQKVGDTVKIYATRSRSHTDKSLSDTSMPRLLAIKADTVK